MQWDVINNSIVVIQKQRKKPSEKNLFKVRMTQADDRDTNLNRWNKHTMETLIRSVCLQLYTPSIQNQFCIAKFCCNIYDNFGNYFSIIRVMLYNHALQCSIVHQSFRNLFFIRKGKTGKSLLWQTKPRRHWKNTTISLQV